MLKKLLTCFVVLTMTIWLSAAAVSAAGSSNVSCTADRTEALPGETVIVVLSNGEMDVDTFTCGVSFDPDKLECVSVISADPDYPDDFTLTLKAGGRNPYVSLVASRPEEANASGNVGFGTAQTKSRAYLSGEIAVITFKVKEGASGTARFSLYESSSGNTGYKGEGLDPFALRIKAEPEPDKEPEKEPDKGSEPESGKEPDTGAEKEEKLPDGWRKNSAGNWCYAKNGRPVTGWLLDGGSWYYLNAGGVMHTGWLKADGKWYFLTGSGAMKTGWLLNGGKWYYLTGSGAMKTGWLWDGSYNAWYYLQDPDGYMLTDTVTPDGYRLGSDGSWRG